MPLLCQQLSHQTGSPAQHFVRAQVGQRVALPNFLVTE
jgi:hypothetical protein